MNNLTSYTVFQADAIMHRITAEKNLLRCFVSAFVIQIIKMKELRKNDQRKTTHDRPARYSHTITKLPFNG